VAAADLHDGAMSGMPSRRRALWLLPGAAVTAVALSFPVPVGPAAIPAAVPRADCGPGSVPERGMQGRVTAADYSTGFRCNLEVVGHTGGPATGGFRTHRYVDPQGRECAYYGSARTEARALESEAVVSFSAAREAERL
jgi:hypothetical protein